MSLDYTDLILYLVGAWGFSNFIYDENGKKSFVTFFMALLWIVIIPIVVFCGYFVNPYEDDDDSSNSGV